MPSKFSTERVVKGSRFEPGDYLVCDGKFGLGESNFDNIKRVYTQFVAWLLPVDDDQTPIEGANRTRLFLKLGNIPDGKKGGILPCDDSDNPIEEIERDKEGKILPQFQSFHCHCDKDGEVITDEDKQKYNENSKYAIFFNSLVPLLPEDSVDEVVASAEGLVGSILSIDIQMMGGDEKGTRKQEPWEAYIVTSVLAEPGSTEVPEEEGAEEEEEPKAKAKVKKKGKKEEPKKKEKAKKEPEPEPEEEEEEEEGDEDEGEAEEADEDGDEEGDEDEVEEGSPEAQAISIYKKISPKIPKVNPMTVKTGSNIEVAKIKDAKTKAAVAKFFASKSWIEKIIEKYPASKK